MLLQHVRERALKVLGLAPTFPLDPLQGLRDVGLDSLLAIELRNALQADVNAPLPATLAFDFPTVEALTAFLGGGPLSAALGGQPAPPPETAPPAAAVGEIAGLTDEEAEALLLSELSGIGSEGRS
jgi:acyl carrier protein